MREQGAGTRVRRTWTADEKRIVAARQAWRCKVCTDLLPATFECDHIVPLEAGGPDCLDSNAQSLCNRCHAEKTQFERMQRIRAAKEKLLSLPSRVETVTPSRDSLLVAADLVLANDNPFAEFVFPGVFKSV